MANRWFLYISELAQKAQQEVTKTPENWQKFLTTASRFYKSYDFDDQLLIYIQRPDAVACADIETWNNKMHRWVNAGSNAIGLIRKGTGGRPYINSFVEIAKKYTSFEKLTPGMLHELVEKIVVHEGDKSSGHRIQKIDIYYSFVGDLESSHVVAQRTLKNEVA